MQKQAFQNMQEYAVPKMQKIFTIRTNEISKIYVLYASIYKNMQITNMRVYANIHMHIHAKKYAEICKTEYAQICIFKICITC